MRIRGTLVWGLAIAALCLPAGSALAAPGELDPTFGNGGRSVIDLGGAEEVQDLLLQPDGKVIVTGSSTASSADRNLFAARLLVPQGTLDPSYAGGFGWSTVDLGGDDRAGHAVLQQDGKIILAGGLDSVEDDYGVARLLNPQGTFDGGFGGGDGRATGLITGADTASALALQPDGRIVIAGFDSHPPPNGRAWLIGRLLNPQGTPDGSFGSGGFVSRDMSGTADQAYGVLVQPDGKILVSGQGGRNEGEGGGFGVVARFLSNGDTDSTFGNQDGRRSGLGQIVGNMVLQPDGKILIVGRDSSSAAVFRLTQNGDLDDSFGGDGRSGATDFRSATDLLLQPDGKIVVVGSAGVGDHEEFGIMRLQPNGLLDTTFGDGGKVRIDFGAPNVYQPAQGVVQQPDGKFIVSGFSQASNILTARLEGDPPGDVAGKCRGKKATIIGTNGKERLKGTNKRDVVSAGGGKDTVKGLKGNDLICGGKGPDKLIGGPGKDTLLGEKGKDRLFGGPQKDKLLGGAAKDFIVGGAANDKINGGPGKDSEKQ